MVTKDKAPVEQNKTQDLKDKAISAKMDDVLDKMLPSLKKTETTPVTAKEATPETTPKPISREDYDKAIQEAKMWQGRVKEMEAIQKEVSTLKKQAETKDTELKSIEAERETLKIQLDELSKDDPEKIALIKMDRELRDKERQLKADRKAHDDEWTEKASRIAISEQTSREIAIFEIASGYDGGDPQELKDKMDSIEQEFNIKITTNDQIKKLIPVSWKPKAATSPTTTPPTTPVTLDSGKTLGDTSKISRQTLASYSPQGKTGKDFAADQDEILNKFFGSK